MDSDVFISHASEDKDDVATPLAQALRDHGYEVWYDQFVLRPGDSLRREIDKGLASCRFGIVILSLDFFKKEWPQKELDGLVAREVADGNKVILPVWHNISRDKIQKYSPTLADRLGVSTARGIPYVVDQIVSMLQEVSRADAQTTTGTVKPRPLLQSFQVEVLLLGVNHEKFTFVTPIKAWAHHKTGDFAYSFSAVAVARSKNWSSIEELNEALKTKQMPQNLVVLHWDTLRKLPEDLPIVEIQKPRVCLVIDQQYEYGAEIFKEFLLRDRWAEAIKQWQQEHMNDP